MHRPNPTPPKISVKQSSTNFKSHQPFNPNPIYHNYHENNNNNKYAYPPNHIVSESSLASCSGLALSRSGINETGQRERRRKIFQRKVLRGTVISEDKGFQNRQKLDSQSPSHYQQVQNQYISPLRDNRPFKNTTQNARYSQQNQFQPHTFHQIPQQPHPIRKSTQKYSNLYSYVHNESLNSHQEPSYGTHDKRNQFNSQQKSLQSHNYGHSSNQKLPSFARGASNDSNLDSKNNLLQAQTFLILSGIPEEVRKMKQELLVQKKQLSTLEQRVRSRTKQNHRRQKQLLGSLIEKQSQLTQKHEQLNQSLENMSKIQNQSNSRYEQLLKYQLELQRTKRVEQLTKQNQKLYQQLLKNAQSHTNDHTPVSVYELQHQPQKPYILSITSPLNNTSMNGIEVGTRNERIKGYFKEEFNWREISALEEKGRDGNGYQGYNEDQDEEGGDNTIRELLSPLEILPDYTI